MQRQAYSLLLFFFFKKAVITKWCFEILQQFVHHPASTFLPYSQEVTSLWPPYQQACEEEPWLLLEHTDLAPMLASNQWKGAPSVSEMSGGCAA